MCGWLLTRLLRVCFVHHMQRWRRGEIQRLGLLIRGYGTLYMIWCDAEKNTRRVVIGFACSETGLERLGLRGCGSVLQGRIVTTLLRESRVQVYECNTLGRLASNSEIMGIASILAFHVTWPIRLYPVMATACGH